MVGCLLSFWHTIICLTDGQLRMLIIIIIDDAVAEITEGDFYCTKRLILFIRQQVRLSSIFCRIESRSPTDNFFLFQSVSSTPININKSELRLHISAKYFGIWSRNPSKNMERVISNNSTSSLLDHRDDNTHITCRKTKLGILEGMPMYHKRF